MSLPNLEVIEVHAHVSVFLPDTILQAEVQIGLFDNPPPFTTFNANISLPNVHTVRARAVSPRALVPLCCLRVFQLLSVRACWRALCRLLMSLLARSLPQIIGDVSLGALQQPIREILPALQNVSGSLWLRDYRHADLELPALRAVGRELTAVNGFGDRPLRRVRLPLLERLGDTTWQEQLRLRSDPDADWNDFHLESMFDVSARMQMSSSFWSLCLHGMAPAVLPSPGGHRPDSPVHECPCFHHLVHPVLQSDRKSTRLNSSH